MPQELFTRLQLVAQVFANALARKLAEEALRESEQRLVLATTAAHVRPWTLNADGTHFWVNARPWSYSHHPPLQNVEAEHIPTEIPLDSYRYF